MRETKLFIGFIAIPAIIGVAGWSYLAWNGWQLMWAAGGPDIEERAAIFATLVASVAFLLAVSFTIGGILLVHMIRHERRNAELKTDFIDNVSHELKTPLAGMRLNAELLSQNRIPDAALRRGALEAILIETDRLTQMIDKLLDLSRLEKGRYRYHIETFNLVEFVKAASEIQAIDAISNSRAKVKFIDAGAMVSADVNALRQIGVNLVANAVKYATGPIDIEVEANEIRYMDRGNGIPRGEEEAIFERFYRYDNSLTRRTGGLGLGLAIARKLARGMGGDIVFSHRHGGGSIFTIKLALADV